MRDNYRLFLAMRDGVLDTGTLEAFYTGLFRQHAITLPPLFIDLVAQTILRQLLDQGADAFEARANGRGVQCCSIPIIPGFNTTLLARWRNSKTLRSRSS